MTALPPTSSPKLLSGERPRSWWEKPEVGDRYLMMGGCGGFLSPTMHEERSKSMNTSAFS